MKNHRPPILRAKNPQAHYYSPLVAIPYLQNLGQARNEFAEKWKGGRSLTYAKRKFHSFLAPSLGPIVVPRRRSCRGALVRSPASFAVGGSAKIATCAGSPLMCLGIGRRPSWSTGRRGAGFVRTVIAAHFHGHEVGPAFLGRYFVNQRLYILVEVGHLCGETEVAPDWRRPPDGCVGLEGDGDGSEFLPEKGGALDRLTLGSGFRSMSPWEGGGKTADLSSRAVPKKPPNNVGALTAKVRAAQSRAEGRYPESHAKRAPAKYRTAQGPRPFRNWIPSALYEEYPPTFSREGAAIWVGLAQQGQKPTSTR